MRHPVGFLEVYRGEESAEPLEGIGLEMRINRKRRRSQLLVYPPEKLDNLNVYGLNGYIACRHFLLKRQARQTGNCVDLTDHSGKIR